MKNGAILQGSLQHFTISLFYLAISRYFIILYFIGCDWVHSFIVDTRIPEFYLQEISSDIFRFNANPLLTVCKGYSKNLLEQGVRI
jgi:hypothetical protein